MVTTIFFCRGAAAYELQRDYPTRAVVLVASDFNLQAKAELADLPVVEPVRTVT